MTRQGVLWDLNGVLLDTGEFHFQAWWRTGLKVIIEP